MTDSVAQFAHDHAALNRRVIELGGLVRGLEQHGLSIGSALVTALAELREQLFLHFAREEEGLFPFIEGAVPDLADSIHAMVIAHDTICGALVRTHHLASTSSSLSTIAAGFERFAEAYAAHASTETAWFEELDTRLDATQRSQLATLIDAL